MLLCS